MLKLALLSQKGMLRLAIPFWEKSATQALGGFWQPHSFLTQVKFCKRCLLKGLGGTSKLLSEDISHKISRMCIFLFWIIVQWINFWMNLTEWSRNYSTEYENIVIVEFLF